MVSISFFGVPKILTVEESEHQKCSLLEEINYAKENINSELQQAEMDALTMDFSSFAHVAILAKSYSAKISGYMYICNEEIKPFCKEVSDFLTQLSNQIFATLETMDPPNSLTKEEWNFKVISWKWRQKTV